MKVFDVFLFGYEIDLLEIRLNLLDPYVDYFVFSESTRHNLIRITKANNISEKHCNEINVP